MTMALSTGLISGMDTGSLVAQLVQAEAAPQTALKARLTATQATASAYRTVNTTFAAVRAAAEALNTAAGLTAGRKVASDNAAATASASAAAVPGNSVTFTATALAATHTVLSTSEWTSTTQKVAEREPAFPIEIRKADGTVVGSISVPADATLSQAVTAINDQNLGVKATIVTLGPNRHRLQFVADTPGLAGRFLVKSATESEAAAGTGFLTSKTGKDATLDLGNGVVATSTSNTFAELMPGVSVTISKLDGTSATISVAADHEAVATKMQALVDAVNAALTTVKTYTSNAPGSTAALKGDFSVTSLAGGLLYAVSKAVGADGPVKLGLQLTKDGKVTFDKAKFTTALKDTPELTERMVAGSVAVPGIAQRLFDAAKGASDATTGSLVALATGQESMVKDIQNRIAAWDLRLEKRRETLTRQFTAMETALSSLRNQSTWLAGQINSLPSSAS
jgi:flagellar hook-associated protein 2